MPLGDRGVVGLGTYGGKFETNWGTVVRTARAFNADFSFTIGSRYRETASSVGHDRHFPVLEFEDTETFLGTMPRDATVVRVDLEGSSDLQMFSHPEKAVYVLGAEDYGFEDEFRAETMGVRIDTSHCLNVATAGAIVLYDRQAKKAESSSFPMLNTLF